MLGADGVAEPCDGPAGAEKIAELMLAVQCGGVPDDVIMNVLFVGVRGNEKGVSAFQKPLGKLIAYAVRVLRRDLSGLKGLAHLIGDHVMPLLPPCDGLVLPLGVKKLRVGGFRVAFVGGDQLAALRLFWILGIVDAVSQAVGNRLAVTDVHGNDACGRHGARPPFGGMDLQLFSEQCAAPIVKAPNRCYTMQKERGVYELCRRYYQAAQRAQDFAKRACGGIECELRNGKPLGERKNRSE